MLVLLFFIDQQDFFFPKKILHGAIESIFSSGLEWPTGYFLKKFREF